MDPGFHRGDSRTGMTETRVDFLSTNSELLGLEPRVVQLHEPTDDRLFQAVRRRDLIHIAVLVELAD